MNSVDRSRWDSDSVLDADDEQLALVLSRYVDELERGVLPDREELLAQHPQLADRLCGYLDELHWFQRALRGVTAEERPAAPQSGLTEGQFGDYRIVREVGRGGMGVVYEARQISLGRTVALKLLPFSGLLDPKQIARFRNEAQAAAGLHHPHIVPVFAVGCENGVHYYSMQFIDGQPLDRVITQLAGKAEWESAEDRDSENRVASDRRPRHIWDVPSTIDLNPTATRRATAAATVARDGLTSTLPTLRTRNYSRNVAELILQAADALQHAHECGVIHRDIKPSNLLVDRHGKLWITDFGLARSTMGPDLTMTGDVLGTVRYMSPEQASGKPHLIDHRTDIYSLGITLFEVLTLRVAFSGDDRHELLRRIQEQAPPSPRSLNSAIPYDLETIVLKAIMKAREDRYATAREFADDLRRFLAGEPTHARRPTLVDRCVKWVGRHKALTAGCFTAVTAALLGVSVAAGLLVAKQRETDAALLRARMHLHDLQQVVDQFGAGVSEELRDVVGAEQVRGKLLRDTLACYETLLKYSADDPTLAADAARAAFKAAAVHEQLGANERALELYRDSHQRYQRLVSAAPRSPSLLADLALVANNRGALLARLGDLQAAVAELRSAAARQEELLEEFPGEPRFCNDWALSQMNLGLALADLGKKDSAARCYRAVLDRLRGNGDLANADSTRQRRLASILHNLSGLMADDDPAQAGEFSSEAAQILRRIPDTSARAELGLVLSNHATLISRQGQLAEGLKFFGESIAIQRDLVERSPQRVPYQVDLATTYNNRGQRLLESGDLASAEADLKEARRIFERLAEQFSDVPLHLVGLATVLDNLGNVWEKRGDSSAAAGAFQKAVELQEAACARAPDVEQFGLLLDRHRANLKRAIGSRAHAKTDGAET